MKRPTIWIIVIAVIVLAGAVVLGYGLGQSNNNVAIEELEPTPTISEELQGNIANNTTGQEKTYTTAQIQTALQPQFQMGDWGEGNPQVISAQKVERDRDSITLDAPGAKPIDLSKSTRYKVTTKFKQPYEDYTFWHDMYKGTEFEPKREGDFTIWTGYYYFNDVNGSPELDFVMD